MTSAEQAASEMTRGSPISTIMETDDRENKIKKTAQNDRHIKRLKKNAERHLRLEADNREKYKAMERDQNGGSSKRAKEEARLHLRESTRGTSGNKLPRKIHSHKADQCKWTKTSAGHGYTISQDPSKIMQVDNRDH